MSLDKFTRMNLQTTSNLTAVHTLREQESILAGVRFNRLTLERIAWVAGQRKDDWKKKKTIFSARIAAPNGSPAFRIARDSESRAATKLAAQLAAPLLAQKVSCARS
jgi:hypothetical protein